MQEKLCLVFHVFTFSVLTKIWHKFTKCTVHMRFQVYRNKTCCQGECKVKYIRIIHKSNKVMPEKVAINISNPVERFKKKEFSLHYFMHSVALRKELSYVFLIKSWLSCIFVPFRVFGDICHKEKFKKITKFRISMLFQVNHNVACRQGPHTKNYISITCQRHGFFFAILASTLRELVQLMLIRKKIIFVKSSL